MTPFRQADARRPSAFDDAERRGHAPGDRRVLEVVPPARAGRHRGRLRRLQVPAPAALRERIVQELRARSSP